MTTLGLSDLLAEYDAAQAYSIKLVTVLTEEQLAWRPDESSSAIAWHLGHQAAVNHFMTRNLTAAEPTFNAGFDAIFDSATPEPARGDVPPLSEIMDYRNAIAASTSAIVARIDRGDVGAPKQLPLIATAMMGAIINHEYQHAKWIGEVRATMTDRIAPQPSSSRLVEVDGYYMLET